MFIMADFPGVCNNKIRRDKGYSGLRIGVWGAVGGGIWKNVKKMAKFLLTGGRGGCMRRADKRRTF
jgi:hypothetical protein